MPRQGPNHAKNNFDVLASADCPVREEALVGSKKLVGTFRDL